MSEVFYKGRYFKVPERYWPECVMQRFSHHKSALQGVPLWEVELSIRAMNVLRNVNIFVWSPGDGPAQGTMWDVVEGWERVLRARNCGKKTIRELYDFLAFLGPEVAAFNAIELRS